MSSSNASNDVCAIHFRPAHAAADHSHREIEANALGLLALWAAQPYLRLVTLVSCRPQTTLAGSLHQPSIAEVQWPSELRLPSSPFYSQFLVLRFRRSPQ